MPVTAAIAYRPFDTKISEQIDKTAMQSANQHLYRLQHPKLPPFLVSERCYPGLLVLSEAGALGLDRRRVSSLHVHFAQDLAVRLFYLRLADLI